MKHSITRALSFHRPASRARLFSLLALLPLSATGPLAQLATLSAESAWQSGTFVTFAAATPMPLPAGSKCFLFVSPLQPAVPITIEGVNIVVDPASAVAIPLPAQPHLWTPAPQTPDRFHKEYKLANTLPAGVTLYMQSVIFTSSGGMLVTNGVVATTQVPGDHELLFGISSTEYWGFGDIKFNVIDADSQVIVADQLTTKMPLELADGTHGCKMVGTPTKSTNGRIASATFFVKDVNAKHVGSDTLVIHADGSYLWLAQPPTTKAWKRVGPPRFRPGDDTLLWVVEQFFNGDSGCFGGNGIDTESDLVAYDPWTGLQVQRFQLEYSGSTSPGKAIYADNWTFDATGSFACFTLLESHVCTPSWARMRSVPFFGPLMLGAPADLTVQIGASGGSDTPMLPVLGSTKILMTVTGNPSAGSQTQPTYLVDPATGAVSLPTLGIGTQSTVAAVSRTGEFFLRIHKNSSQAGQVHAFGIPAVVTPGAAMPLLSTYTIEKYGLETQPVAQQWSTFYDHNSFVPAADGAIVFGPRQSYAGWMYCLSPHTSGIPEQTQFDPYFNSGATYRFGHAQNASTAPRGTAGGVGLRDKNLILTSVGVVGSTPTAAAMLNVTTMTACDMTPVALGTPPQGTAAVDALNHTYLPIEVRL
jgi:hypothetical protein